MVTHRRQGISEWYSDTNEKGWMYNKEMKCNFPWQLVLSCFFFKSALELWSSWMKWRVVGKYWSGEGSCCWHHKDQHLSSLAVQMGLMNYFPQTNLSYNLLLQTTVPALWGAKGPLSMAIAMETNGNEHKNSVPHLSNMAPLSHMSSKDSIVLCG